MRMRTRAPVTGSLEEVEVQGRPRVMLRGTRMPDAPTPLIVVDGVITTQAALDEIDPSRIESVEVLKGAAAEKLYGERAANGVIRVTMKR